jgi:transcriptional regulator with XRE-family HTH domain
MEKSFSARIRVLRGAMSQTTFARMFGVKQTTYSGWEQGIKEPSFKMITKMALDLGISADWLLGLSDDRTGKITTIADPQQSIKIAELESEITRLKGENAGLRHAIEVFSNIKK